MGPSGGMAGRRIRWRILARIAAVALAAAAAVASLPALLGSGAPPPVPDDVGLAPPLTAATDPPSEPLSPAPPPIESAVVRKREAAERADESDQDRPRRRRNRRRRAKLDRDDDASEARSVPVEIPASAYSPYPPPATRGEFGIEP